MVRTHVKLVALAATLTMACSLAKAAPVTAFELKDQNSVVAVDLANGAGVQSWAVNGINHLFQQWFWIGIGDKDPQRPINELGLLSSTAYGDRILEAVFGSDQGVKVTVTLMLTGAAAGSRGSDLSESIRIDNMGGTAESIHFFQYVDFDLNATNDDVAIFANNNTVQQHGSQPGLTVSETIVTPVANHREINTRDNLLAKLNGAAATLSDTTSSVTGDVAWAFQWNYNLGAGKSADIISKDMSLKSDPVPLPASVWMGALLLGGIGITSIRRRLAA